jgi:hypothetical protein
MIILRLTLRSSPRRIKVNSRVSHGSVLGSLLFLIYINDTDEVVMRNILKFANDTKFLWGCRKPARLTTDNKMTCGIHVTRPQIGLCSLMLIHVRSCILGIIKVKEHMK